MSSNFAACIEVFGDHQNPTYQDALNRHYQEGPPWNWQDSFMSSYARMHPWEDFAESFAKYLAIVSVLDTARHTGIGEGIDPTMADIIDMIQSYQQLGLVLNEMNRSMGILDLIPEVLVPSVVEKLRFIHRCIRQVHSDESRQSAHKKHVHSPSLL